MGFIKGGGGSSGGGGAYSLLFTQTLGATGPFDFINILPTANDLILIAVCRSVSAVTDQWGYVNFNGDSAAHYLWSEILNAGISSGGPGAIPNTIYVPGASATANSWGYAEIVIPNYPDTTKKKGWLARSGEQGGTQAFSITEGEWSGTAAINRVTVAPFTGAGFIAGSVARLYGRL